MINRKKTTLSIFFFLAFLSASLANVASAGSLDKKLEQCKQEFALSHSKDAKKDVAAAANLRHLKLMKEILHELNKTNADKKMTNSELQENVMVMSHLLEMLVTENLKEKDATWNLNY